MALGFDDGFGFEDAAALLTGAQAAWWAARAFTEEHRTGLRALLRGGAQLPPGEPPDPQPPSR